MPLSQFILNLRKSDIQSNAAIFGEYLPGSLKKDIITERLAEIYERNTNAFLSMFSVSVVPNDFYFIEHQLNRWQEMEDCACDILLAYGILEKQTFYRMFGGCYPALSLDEASTFLCRRLAVLGASDCLNIGGELWIFSILIDYPVSWYHAMIMVI